MNTYEIINDALYVTTEYKGTDRAKAEAIYQAYAAAGEPVIMYQNGVIIKAN